MISQLIKKNSHKTKLKNTFNIAGLYYTTKRNGKTFYNFPSVIDVRFKEDVQGSPITTTYVFRLPHGVDPLELKKKEFVFRSMFGDLIEFKGTNVVSLTVYHTVHYGSFAYNYDEMIKEAMSKHKLPIIAGKDVNGKFWSYDMTVNPHLLIAGETGSGKSVMLRAVLTSLIQHKRTGLQLHLGDLKRSEFHLFRHVDIVKAVMTKKPEVAKCVKWFHKQLEIRGDLLDAHEVSHVDELPEDKRVDYLVLCIDEFSMLRSEGDCIEELTNIVALGRALGIYVILSTQRPSAKIIVGELKANLTVVFAFKHLNKVNSRITLGDGIKEDASAIPDDEKGKFYMKYRGMQYVQSPYLPIEDEYDKETKKLTHIGAKTILKEYKVPVHERTDRDKKNSSGNVIDYEGEVTESDMYDEVEAPAEPEVEDLTQFMIGGDENNER